MRRGEVQGGHVFVLQSRAGHRAANAHAVKYGATQWCRYLARRDTLRISVEARHRYASEKQHLIATLGRDKSAGGYTAAKSSVVAELLR